MHNEAKLAHLIKDPKEKRENRLASSTKLLVCLLFVIIAGTMGQFYKRWWFNGCDDFHAYYLIHTAQTHRDTCNFFHTNGHLNRDAGPSNHTPTQENPSFLGAYYRPLQLIYSTWLYWLFGTNAAGFFLVNVLIHALNAVLLFLLFASLTSPTCALFASFLFAFHPQIAYRFGPIANVHYYVETFFFLLIVLLLKRYLNKPHWQLLVTMALLFLAALFTREVILALPAALFLITPNLTSNHRATCKQLLYPFIALATTACLFLGLRLYLYPLQHISNMSTISVFNWITTKATELKICFYDCLWLSWLPWGNTPFRLCITSTLLCILTMLFLWNAKKLLVLRALGAACLMLWPGIIGHYSPRYFYEMSPFVLLAFVTLITYYQGPGKKLYRLGYVFMLIISTLLLWFTCDSFERRATKLDAAGSALHKLLDDPKAVNKPLCFLSYPADVLGDQPAEMCWVMRGSNTIPVYCDTMGSLVQTGSHIVTPTRWINRVSDYYDINYVTITPVPGGVRYTTHNPEKMSFALDNGYSLGTKIIHATTLVHDEQKITDYTLIIDKKYRSDDLVCCIWDWEKKEFLIKEFYETNS